MQRGAFKVAGYEIDGRPSLFLTNGSRDWMRIETHAESLSVLWSTRRPPWRLLRLISSELPAEAELLMVTATGRRSWLGPRKVKALVRLLSQVRAEMVFLRLDFPDRVMTWESQGRRRRVTSKRVGPRSVRGEIPPYAQHQRGELGLLALGLDAPYVSALVRRTGTARVAQSADDLVAEARAVTERYPEVNLGRDQQADAW